MASSEPIGTKPRNEQGRFLAKSDAELRAQWEREGGYQQKVQRVLAVESAILSRSENAAGQSAINELPKDIVLKAADVMRSQLLTVRLVTVAR
jgi:hypothetical protein